MNDYPIQPNDLNQSEQNYSPMFIVGNTIVSAEIISKNFVCNIEKCKGVCCIEGDQGAPLNHDDIEKIQEHIEEIKFFMSEKGKTLYQEKGFYETDPDGDLVTTCLPTGECVFVIYKNGILECAIQKANQQKKWGYPKPISCHMYPIRIKEFESNDALSYDRWHVCNPACQLGDQLKVPVYEFLKEPLIRKYGDDWYQELNEIAKHWEKQ